MDEAVDLVREAGELTLRWFRRSDLDIETKGDGTPVTAADKGAERLIRDRLAARHPDDAVLGEEEGSVEGTSGRRWIVDPIDGTKAFTHGVPLYSNLLLVEDEHGPLIAVVNLPALGETVYAGRGLGAFTNGARTHVNDRASLDGAFLMTSGFGSWPPAMLAAAHARPGLFLRTWGDGYGYAMVATGRAEGMVDPSAAVWDLAPMPLLLAEAGGRFTDLGGTDGYEGGDGLGTNGVVHDELMALLAPHRVET